MKIAILPYHRETLVLSEEVNTVIKNLQKAVLHEKDVRDPEMVKEEKLFVGRVEISWFRIFRRVNQPNNYLPLIIGQIEGTSVGSIIFVKYRLFQSTNFFLLFWSLISLGFGTFFIVSQQEYLFGIAAYSFGVINYLVTIINFNRYTKRDKNLLHKSITQS